MKILHYSLGFPPYRSGGLTKFCMDLMKEQIRQDHEVALLWPGRMHFFYKATYISKSTDVLIDDIYFKSFELINSLPISYDEGIKDFEKFEDEGNFDVYYEFLKAYNPQVIHIHTLMGLHKNFLVAARDIGIKLVYTAHDFFPICPRVTIYRHGQICSSVNDCSECGYCNSKALSINKIRMLQSPLYRILKDSVVVRKMRKKHRDSYLGEQSVSTETQVGTAADYKNLRAHYESMIRLMDVIHYNSTITEQVYSRFFGKLSGYIIPISHGDIKDNRKIKIFNEDTLRIRYLGPYGGAKGFFYLKATLDRLWNARQDFCLDVHFKIPEPLPYIREHEKYSYSDLESIFDNTDVLVAPSIWYEAFGYTVLEALSYGVPVIISSTVGAKDILADGAGIVVDFSKENDLYDAIKGLNSHKLQSMNEIIIERQNIITIETMTKMIEEKCYKKIF